jgi:hypothetical protein
MAEFCSWVAKPALKHAVVLTGSPEATEYALDVLKGQLGPLVWRYSFAADNPDLWEEASYAAGPRLVIVRGVESWGTKARDALSEFLLSKATADVQLVLMGESFLADLSPDEKSFPGKNAIQPVDCRDPRTERTQSDAIAWVADQIGVSVVVANFVCANADWKWSHILHAVTVLSAVLPALPKYTDTQQRSLIAQLCPPRVADDLVTRLMSADRVSAHQLADKLSADETREFLGDLDFAVSAASVIHQAQKNGCTQVRQLAAKTGLNHVVVQRWQPVSSRFDAQATAHARRAIAYGFRNVTKPHVASVVTAMF